VAYPDAWRELLLVFDGSERVAPSTRAQRMICTRSKFRLAEALPRCGPLR
jgi:hypothetical protein